MLNFGTVHGGIALNMIAEECTLRVSYRTLPDADPLDVYNEIQRRLTALDDHDYAGREHRAKIETKLLNVVPPLDSAARNGSGSGVCSKSPARKLPAARCMRPTADGSPARASRR